MNAAQAVALLVLGFFVPPLMCFYAFLTTSCCPSGAPCNPCSRFFPSLLVSRVLNAALSRGLHSPGTGSQRQNPCSFAFYLPKICCLLPKIPAAFCLVLLGASLPLPRRSNGLKEDGRDSNKPLLNLTSSLEVAGPSISVGFGQMSPGLGHSPRGWDGKADPERRRGGRGVFTWVGLGGLHLQLRSYRLLKIGSNSFPPPPPSSSSSCVWLQTTPAVSMGYFLGWLGEALGFLALPRTKG